MKLLLLAILLCPITVSAQHTFKVQNPAGTINVAIEIEKCEEGRSCRGASKFAFSRRGQDEPFQVINLPDTIMWLDDDKPQVNRTLLYDEQSVMTFDDFNFDGLEDVAICDGNNGAYGMPSYQVYLYSKAEGRFTNNAAFTKLGQEYLGMFEVDPKRKRLSTLTKSGCCWHQAAEYIVVNNVPKMVLEITDDATYTGQGGDKVKVTTRRLVKGRWQTSVKYVKRED